MDEKNEKKIIQCLKENGECIDEDDVSVR